MRAAWILLLPVACTPPPHSEADPRVDALEACLAETPPRSPEADAAVESARLAAIESCVSPFVRTGRRVEIPPIVLTPPAEPVSDHYDLRRRLDVVEARLARLETRQPSSRAPAVKTETWNQISVVTKPAVPVRHNGVSMASNAPVPLGGAAGLIEIGKGRDRVTDPFAAKLRYEIERGFVVFSINAEPWAIVRGADGLGLGKTPLAGVRSGAGSVFELINPKRDGSLRIAVRFGSGRERDGVDLPQ